MPVVQDGIRRVASQDPSAHRELWTVDPAMLGRDVENLQRALIARLRFRGFGRDEIPVATHGQFTFATGAAATEAQYWLGLRADTYLKHDDKGHRCLTVGAQQVIRDPDKYRTAEQEQRARDHRAQLERGPRYFDELLREHEQLPGRTNLDVALAWALDQVGITEQPAGSNWGPHIETWIRAAGYTGPVPWCGCFANAFIMAAGLPSGAGWIGYTPAIVAHAKQNIGGWTWHGPGDGRRGDLALFDTPGGDPAVHVAVTRKQLSSTRYATVEGNTSSGNGGSQANGGMVAARERSTEGYFRIIGFARPPF